MTAKNEALNYYSKYQKDTSAGVIDIGSNAIRMMIAYIDQESDIVRQFKSRESIRFGLDVFGTGSISQENIGASIRTFSKFTERFEEFDVEKSRIVATSAVREAANGKAYIDEVFEKSGLKIEIIDFKEESFLIAKAACRALKLKEKSFLLMDIGGGSVEFVLSKDGHMVNSISLPLGTLRLLRKTQESDQMKSELEQITSESINEVKNLLKKIDHPVDHFVGTGGNLECLGFLRQNIFNKTSFNKIKSHELEYIVTELFLLPPERRMRKFGLRADRNDVILPASLLTNQILKELNLPKILLPGVGLREGALLQLLAKH